MLRLFTRDQKPFETAEIDGVVTRREATILAGVADRFEASPGTTLTIQDELGRHVYLIEHGTVLVTRGDEVVALVEGANLVGEMAALATQRHTATVTAVDDVSGWVIPVRMLPRVLEQIPGLQERFKATVDERLDAA